jgi:hypothetical protein
MLHFSGVSSVVDFDPTVVATGATGGGGGGGLLTSGTIADNAVAAAIGVGFVSGTTAAPATPVVLIAPVVPVATGDGDMEDGEVTSFVAPVVPVASDILSKCSLTGIPYDTGSNKLDAINAKKEMIGNIIKQQKME